MRHRNSLDILARILVVVVVMLILFVVAWRHATRIFPMGVQPETKEKRPPTAADIVGEEMNGKTVAMRVGDVKSVVLRGNATTGYAWRVVRVDGGSVVADGKWEYKVSFPFMTGSGGFFLRRFRAVAPGQTDVYMTYDPVSEPQGGYSYVVRFTVG